MLLLCCLLQFHARLFLRCFVLFPAFVVAVILVVFVLLQIDFVVAVIIVLIISR